MRHSPPPSIAVDLFLTVVFVIACRWIKRNPSSFLRYILFPFGGLNVERWPGLMLAIVRVSAVLGFFPPHILWTAGSGKPWASHARGSLLEICSVHPDFFLCSEGNR